MTGKESFEKELEIFRTEAYLCAMYYYTYLAIESILSRNRKILDIVNETPSFWNTNISSLQTSTFIVLHRIFDSKSKHNINKLLLVASNNLDIFSKKALGERKKQMSQNADEWIDEYLTNVYVPYSKDFERLSKHVLRIKNIYNNNYMKIRHMYYAHKIVSSQSEVSRLFAKTTIAELEKIVVFLLKTYDLLWELYYNGKKPVYRKMPYSINSIIKRKYYKWGHNPIHVSMVNETKVFLNNLIAKA
jgi:hypothetical protein